VLPALLLKPFGRWGLLRSMKVVAGVDHRRTPEIAAYLALIFAQFQPRRTACRCSMTTRCAH
jgi:hypothetical protein